SASWLDQLPQTDAIKNQRFFDFNGDGRQDLIWVRRQGSTQYVEYAQVTASGMRRTSFSNGSSELTYTNVSNTDAHSIKVEAIDYNADGRMDVLVCKPHQTLVGICESWEL